MKVDLHMHSHCSDGSMPPEELAKKVWEQGIGFASLTDHDTISGQERFMRAAKQLGVKTITGVEFSVEFPGELHILGYGMKLGLPILQQTFQTLLEKRRVRTENIIQKLKNLGIAIELDQVEQEAGSEIIGRPHIAKALVKNGYVKDIGDAFDRYLSRGCPGFCEREKLDKAYTIDLIKKCGGIAVLAHPGLVNTDDIGRLIGELKDLGLGGVEAYYPVHSNEQVAFFENTAKQLGILVTVGSDYHGDLRKDRSIGCEKRCSEYLEKSIAALGKFTE